MGRTDPMKIRVRRANARHPQAEPPPKSAPKADWVAYAARLRIDEADAEQMTKNELVALLGR